VTQELGRLSGVDAGAQVPGVVWNPPTFAAGPCSTQALAKREAARANERHGGPGFLVEDRNGGVSPTPHAYFAEQSSTGEWYVVLKEMPSGRMTLL
jgi:hypothetical protein